jgi:hypothetical protein
LFFSLVSLSVVLTDDSREGGRAGSGFAGRLGEATAGLGIMGVCPLCAGDTGAGLLSNLLGRENTLVKGHIQRQFQRVGMFVPQPVATSVTSTAFALSFLRLSPNTCMYPLHLKMRTSETSGI